MNNSTSLLTTSIEALTNAKVLCIGDVMLDRFIYGKVDRISPEAPIPIFKIESSNLMLGGAANVACNLSGLGATTHFIGVVGNDSAGKDVTKLIGEIPNTVPNLITDQGRHTAIKTRFIASGQQMMRADDETVSGIKGSIKERVLTLAKSALNDCGAMVLADYGKGVFTPNIIQELIFLGKKAGVPIIIDPQGLDYSQYKGAFLITPNRKELSEATAQPTNSDDEIISAARKLIVEHKIGFVLATRSGDGMSLIDEKSYNTFAAEAREVFDVSGAGDTVAATITASLAAGVSLNDAVRLANVAAGIVVAKVGTAVAYASDIIDALHHQEFSSGELKIFSINSALDRTKVWREKGHKIGFTNGCFDLLHPGHISTINKAKAACDKLVIGLNSDESVKRLKGESRPIQSESARAQVLASLENVDAVIIFSESTPLKILETLKPEIFVKGADYTISDIPEAEIVQAYGGEIVLAEIKKGYSTTATVSKLNK
jgi:D-beta-D-heptose 7-phosphate kinase/D-beta-D-heptose 1-phosphate adenosyltransferase